MKTGLKKKLEKIEEDRIKQAEERQKEKELEEKTAEIEADPDKSEAVKLTKRIEEKLDQKSALQVTYEDAKNVLNAFASGRLSLKKTLHLLDDNKDGKISVREIRRHRYSIAIGFALFVLGSVVFNTSETAILFVDHTKALTAVLGAGVIGVAFGWLFSDN